MKKELLEEAARLVEGSRKDDYGTTKASFTNISNLWTTYLKHPVTPADVAAMMILLKLSRSQNNPAHRDSWVDIAGYAACGFEVAHGE